MGYITEFAAPSTDPRAKAAELLGNPEATPEAVKAAYRRKVMANHPDHGGDGAQLQALKAARDLLLAAPAESPAPLNQKRNDETGTTCSMCNGRGRVGTGFGATCSVCNGEGII